MAWCLVKYRMSSWRGTWLSPGTNLPLPDPNLRIGNISNPTVMIDIPMCRCENKTYAPRRTPSGVCVCVCVCVCVVQKQEEYHHESHSKVNKAQCADNEIKQPHGQDQDELRRHLTNGCFLPVQMMAAT
jgi:hypothetical protein